MQAFHMKKDKSGTFILPNVRILTDNELRVIICYDVTAKA